MRPDKSSSQPILDNSNPRQTKKMGRITNTIITPTRQANGPILASARNPAFVNLGNICGFCQLSVYSGLGRFQRSQEIDSYRLRYPRRIESPDSNMDTGYARLASLARLFTFASAFCERELSSAASRGKCLRTFKHMLDLPLHARISTICVTFQSSNRRSDLRRLRAGMCPKHLRI
jgi:hypothetical protein